MKLSVIPYILSGVILNTAAQLLLKVGVNRIGYIDFSWAKLINLGMQIAVNPYIIMGLSAYVVSVVVWLLVLSRVEVSVAYPMISLGYILNAITAYYILGEELSLSRIMGILIILCGVYFVART